MDALHDLVSQIEEYAHGTHPNPRRVLYSEGDAYVSQTDYLDDITSSQKTPKKAKEHHLDLILETDPTMEEDSSVTLASPGNNRADLHEIS